MSSSLPQEIVDHIIDHLQDEPRTLSACCLVSKAWIQRTRKYLFAKVKFHPFRRHIKQWRRTFLDPANSPAHNTRILSIPQPHLIAAVHIDTLLTFCGVIRLDVNTDLMNDIRSSLIPLHGFSPVLRSLHLTFASLPNSEIFNLVYSFPLLEDLTLVSRASRYGRPAWNIPSTSPRFTGSLELHLREGIYRTVYQMLDLPNGLHFTSIAVQWFSDRDVEATMRLVSRCSNTLESLSITNYISRTSRISPIDLSPTRLRDLVFRCKNPSALWIVDTLRTVKPESIQQVSLDMSRHSLWALSPGWLELDSLLVQLWDSHSLRVKITYESLAGVSEYARRTVEGLLPQVTSRRIADMVERTVTTSDFPSFTMLD